MRVCQKRIHYLRYITGKGIIDCLDSFRFFFDFQRKYLIRKSYFSAFYEVGICTFTFFTKIHFKGGFYVLYRLKTFNVIHSGQKCLPRVAYLWSKMPMFQGAGMREGGEPLPLAFQYLIFMVQRPCDLKLVMISRLASKCQDFKFEMPFFQPLYVMKLKTSNLKVLAFCC